MIAGHGSAAESDRLLRRVGEILLAADPSWQLRHLSPAGDGADAPHRLGLKRALDELCRTAAPAKLLAIAGVVHETADGPALVAAPEYAAYPEEATLPLAWIGARIATALEEGGDGAVVIALSLQRAAGAGSGAEAPDWLAALGLSDPRAAVVAVDAATGEPLLSALASALLGEALASDTGTITVGRLTAYLADLLPRSAVLRPPAAAAASLFSVAPSLERRLELGLAWPATGAEPATDLLGTVLPGGVRVDAVIARSSASVVYRGHQLAVGRDVAIKVLHGEASAGSENWSLFVHEIQAVGRLDHPNVVRIYQADVTRDGRLFFVMELLAGSDLQRLLDAGAVPAERAAALMRQLLLGLAAVHEAGLVHADVKPANAMLVPRREGGERLVLIDFGFSRLRPASEQGGVRSAGGTLAFMAPEQLRRGRIDARSDVFAAGLIMVALRLGWRRRSRAELVPPLDELEPSLRAPLARALALEPTARFATAAEMAAALAGEVPRQQAAAPPPPPFRRLAAFTEEDSVRFFGRDQELEKLVSQVLYCRIALLTAPSGTGKTSLLRGGLLPRLAALGAHPRYSSCRVAPVEWIEEVKALAASAGARRVLLVDQLEVLDDGPEGAADPLARIRALATSGAWPSGLSLVLSVREDHLARILGRLQPLDDLALVRLGPLTRAGASEAIRRPLAEHRFAITPALLDRLLEDLEVATSALGPELGWGERAGIYPPHLQLACSVLYDALGPGEVELTEAHYQRLGGLEAIVGEHLDRVLESELGSDEAAVARDLFLALVNSGQGRAVRNEPELLSVAGAGRGDARVLAVLEVLRSQGLLVRLRRAGDEPAWELVHDCLVPRVLGWIDRRDLARRQILEQLRHHLRRSTPELPSLLSRAELRELRAHPGAVAALEEEWSRRALAAGAWTPSRLVLRSQRVARRTLIATLSIATLAVVAVSAAAVDRRRASAAAAREQTLRDRDQGHFVLELAPFDWDATAMKPRPRSPADLPALRWRLHRPDQADRDLAGEALDEARLTRGTPTLVGLARRQLVEAPGGAAFLVVDGRGRAGERCAPSVIPLRALPGYASRNGARPVLRIPVPTCQASLADTVEIPAGPYLRGGAGDPPSAKRLKDPALRQVRRVELGRYRIDRFELTNAAIAPLVEISEVSGIRPPVYVEATELEGADEPAMPATNLTWAMARTYCAFWGKRLPTSQEWEKAFRGGLSLPDGSVNPVPLRSTAWGTAPVIGFANLSLHESFARLAKVGGYASDRSPYGLYDMTGNVSEWLAFDASSSERHIRGGNWGVTLPNNFAEFTASDNPRPPDAHDYGYGVRCAQDPD